MKIIKFHRLGHWLLLFVTTLLVAEGGVRALGLVDFPLYDADAQIGYIPAANQQGSFLRKNDWAFNTLHMGAGAFAPGPGHDVLLVGDSVVYGGNGYRQQDRLGPGLQALVQGTGGSVWPISAGSWALRNELAYLRQHPQVLTQVDQVVFVLNSGDFGEASSWSCEATHPRTRPVVALWYLFNKYVYAVEKCGQVPKGLQMPPGDLAAELQTFLAEHTGKASFVLYPDRAELVNPALETEHFATGRALLAAAGAPNVVRVAGDSRWSSLYYKDAIHPTPEGNRVLAAILASQIDSN
ncbi:MAG: hypothetical protein NDI95_05995 [Acidovorax soli]|uniref:hypothetical protein n=1 Tax=Acidovorax soli TaxID=592050 RepID=UPI0026ECC48E|nr:hypothetical protein [Acidovorax soli]MCM2346185.1 hypothetical protein [Acidovorax soli]